MPKWTKRSRTGQIGQIRPKLGKTRSQQKKAILSQVGLNWPERVKIGQKAPKHKRPNQSLIGQTNKIGQKHIKIDQNRPNVVQIDRNWRRQVKEDQTCPK